VESGDGVAFDGSTAGLIARLAALRKS
jgi:hypothetical protein